MRFLTPEWHDRLDSTNTALLQRLASGEALAPGFVLAAREQTAGRGRYDRRWVAEAGQNLTFSFLLVTQASADRLASLPLALALGVADMLDAYGIDARVKWPNDVLIDAGKVCGMLLERSPVRRPDGVAVVAGIGLNVNMDAATAALIGRPATSMRIETGREYVVDDVLRDLLHALPGRLASWSESGFAGLRDAWLSRCALLGAPVRVGEGAAVLAGVLDGFGDFGQLQLRLPDGTVREVWAGDLAAI